MCFFMLDECIIVNEGLKVKLYLDKVMVDEFNRSLGNVRFVWNNLLTEYQKTFELFKQHGYTKLKCNQTTFNTMLTMLKKEYPFLYDSESSTLQQVYRDLIRSFNGFFKKNSNYPRFKSKKNPKNGFRIQNNNNIKITSNTIVLPKLGKVHYRTSPQYKQLLKESKINNVTIKKEHNHYYAVFNIETEKQPMKKTGEAVGIDLGIRTLATLSNGLKITNLDTTREDKMIKKYHRALSRKKYNSNRYNKTLKTLGKWIQRKKQPHKRCIPQIKPLHSKKLRHNLHGKPRHKRNIPKYRFKLTPTKHIMEKTSRHDKIQMRVVWKKIHPNKQMVSFKQKLQPMRILLQRLRRQKRMDMSTLPNTP